MTNAEQKTPRGGTRLWVRVLLIASLAFNLLVVGIVAGAALNWPNWQRHHPPRLDMAGGPLTQALAREDRRAIGRKMRQAYRDGHVPHADMRAELDGLVQDLKASPFDPAALETRMARHHGIFNERFQLGQRLLLEHLTQMPPEDRAAYADRLREALEKHRDGRWHKHRRD